VIDHLQAVVRDLLPLRIERVEFSEPRRDPDRTAAARSRFDLTGSELARLEQRGVPYEIARSFRVIGRP